MNVGELKMLLEGVDNSTVVYIPESLDFTGVLYSPDVEESGPCTFTKIGDNAEEKGFLLAPPYFGQPVDRSYTLN